MELGVVERRRKNRYRHPLWKRQERFKLQQPQPLAPWPPVENPRCLLFRLPYHLRGPQEKWFRKQMSWVPVMERHVPRENLERRILIELKKSVESLLKELFRILLQFLLPLYRLPETPTLREQLETTLLVERSPPPGRQAITTCAPPLAGPLCVA